MFSRRATRLQDHVRHRSTVTHMRAKRGQWRDPAAVQTFFDSIASSLPNTSTTEVKEPNSLLKRLYSVSADQLKRSGGSGLLRMHGDSIIKTLQYAYPNHSWIPWEFQAIPRGVLVSPQSRREFFDWILRHKLQADSLDAWYSVSTSQLRSLRIMGMLKRYYNGSLFHALKLLYPERSWLPWKFTCGPRNLWTDLANRRAFFDWAASQLFPGLPATAILDQWYTVSLEKVGAIGGQALLAKYYGNSLKDALINIYPDHQWDPHRFAYTGASTNERPWKVDMSGQQSVAEGTPSCADIDRLMEEHYANRYRIRNIYVFGSRVYGCAKPDSDWDLTAIVDGPYFYSSMLIDTPTIQLNIFHIEYFKELLSGNFITAIIVVYLPKQFRLKEEVPLEFTLKIPTLQRSVRMDSSHNYNKARRLFKQGDIYTAKKNFCHGLRYLLFALQLVERGEIYDFSAGNIYWEEIMRSTATTVQHYEKTYEPVYNDLTERLVAVQPSSVIDFLSSPANPQLLTSQVIRQRGIAAIAKDWGITIRRDSEFPSLVHFTHDPSSPMETRIAQECNGLVLNEANDWAVTAFPFLKIFTSSSEAQVIPRDLDFASAKLYELLDGKATCLYWCDQSSTWRIATKWSSDGSERLGGINLTKYADWQKYVTQNTAHFSAVHPNKGNVQLIPGDKNNQESVAGAFWRLWSRLGYSLPDDLDAKTRCYMFELILPGEVNVVEHTSEDLLLVGCRNIKTLLEVPVEEIADTFGWHCVKRVDMTGTPWNIGSVEAMVRSLDPTKCAGFVLCDSVFTRLQIRNPSFHALEKLHPMNDDNMNRKLILDLVRSSPHRTWVGLPKYAHWASLHDEIQSKYDKFCSDLEAIYSPIQAEWSPQKRGKFAAIAKAQPSIVGSLLFDLMDLDCKLSLKEYLAGLEPLWKLQKLMSRWEEHNIKAKRGK